MGGGSLRIYRSDVQACMFEAIGLSTEEAEDKFGWLLQAFELGAPPHGGIAFGLDRLIMLIAGSRSIRRVCLLACVSDLRIHFFCSDVIAFPKTAGGTCLLSGAPGHISESQLRDVHLVPMRPQLGGKS